MVTDSPVTGAAPRKAAPRDPLGQALQLLDAVLRQAVDAQARVLGPASLLDPWRGLHLDAADVLRLLGEAAAPAGPIGAADALAAAALELPRVARAADWLRLGTLDLAALLIVLAPDLDLRYERLYGYLNDDLARRRPTQDLLARLLGPSPAQRLDLLARFDAGAPLIAQGLLGPLDEPAGQPALAHGWHVRPLWLHWLLGGDSLAGPLRDCARLHAVPAAPLTGDVAEPAALALLQSRVDAAARQPLRLLLQGPHGAGKFALAQALAGALGLSLLVVDVRGWDTAEQPALLRDLRCAAGLLDALPYLHGIDALARKSPQSVRALGDALAAPQGWFVLGTLEPWPTLHARPLQALRLQLALPSPARRESLWQHALARRGLQADAAAVSDVAHRFALSAAQIEQSAADLAEASASGTGYAALAAAARGQSGAALARLAQRICPQAALATLVAAPALLQQLHEIGQRMAGRERVRREWGGGSVHARAVGVSALFAGPSGTGKTLAAEALAHELGLDLVRIDLATIVSKYIGETEKNLDALFTAAESANAVLFFDEADALFGKRSEVKDAHDRYANIEVAYLLQKMEQFDGLAVLATNLRQNLDEAFTRRLTFAVNFPFPEAVERERLWEALWPPLAPRADDVDLAWFAREHRLSGGHIRNAVLAAAHLATADGTAITRAHLLHATRREFQKMGRIVADETGASR